MLNKVKAALRVSAGTTAFDDEITGLINAAKADLRLVGINVPEEETPAEGETTAGDPLILRAVILYAKANFGFIDESEKYQKAYDYLKCSLSLAGDYNAVD
ncbi:hypothetical protein UNSWDHB_2617 [Dehalobacter sp. UNSWDHB]|uniref:phage head-tail connector protein n=1 Tax=Dehalobacter sp. UNSWDHB TaxID=1339256 RepID=UPI000387A05C|nr:phage gp6-like head-tail connector protein [Dehalobacter sp. UNSWDHB]EQB20031.1 hypothetical protein UNSWDHB_2617 [Dehalobacter sp. UNSWDHB]